MPEHGSKRLPDQAGQGRRLGFLELGLNGAEQKSPTFGLNTLAIQTTQ